MSDLYFNYLWLDVVKYSVFDIHVFYHSDSDLLNT